MNSKIHTNAPRVVVLSDYINSDYPTFCTNSHDASIHIRIEGEVEEPSDIG